MGHVRKHIPVQGQIHQLKEDAVLDVRITHRRLLLPRQTVFIVHLHNILDDVLHGSSLEVLLVKRVEVDRRHHVRVAVADQKPLHRHIIVLLYALEHSFITLPQQQFRLLGDFPAKFLKFFHGKYTPDSPRVLSFFDGSPCAHSENDNSRGKPRPPALRNKKKRVVGDSRQLYCT